MSGDDFIKFDDVITVCSVITPRVSRAMASLSPHLTYLKVRYVRIDDCRKLKRTASEETPVA
jgi:hypothetical protein